MMCRYIKRILNEWLHMRTVSICDTYTTLNFLLVTRAKITWHWGHWKGESPVCVRRWTTNWLEFLLAYGQIWHLQVNINYFIMCSHSYEFLGCTRHTQNLYLFEHISVNQWLSYILRKMIIVFLKLWDTHLKGLSLVWILLCFLKLLLSVQE